MRFLKYIALVAFFIWNFLFVNNLTLANIDLAISPIKYEIETYTWSIITREAKLLNKWDTSINIITWKSDFQSNWIDWKPSFVRKSELVYPNQQLSNWITIDTEQFTINPWEEKIIRFTINVPANATPGWHYGAVFFKNNNSETTSWTQIWVNVDYWVLLLVNIEWRIITSWEVDEDEIKIINNIEGWATYKYKDDCPLWDYTYSKYDWKCINTPFTDDTETNSWSGETDDNTNDDNTNNEDGIGTIIDDKKEDFNISFEIPFKNNWNTHISPEWQIKLIDEDWNNLKGIWKEIIKNDLGAVIWEKIVDYLPINDIGWNVLPSTKRDFETKWEWFPYEDYNDQWNKVIRYWDPSEYYTKKNIEEKGFLMFWEKVCEEEKHKKVTALINIAYEDTNWESVEFNSAKDFYVDYKEKYIWLNYYVVIPFLLFLLLIWIYLLFILIKRFKKDKYTECIKCKKKIRKDWDVCPHCSKKQIKKNK